MAGELQEQRTDYLMSLGGLGCASGSIYKPRRPPHVSTGLPCPPTASTGLRDDQVDNVRLYLTNE